jgi:hypothetical protein
VSIEHHGADLKRIDKIRYLAAVPDLMARVRVCFQGRLYNCGECQKCLMTSAGLRALGLESDAMPRLEEPRALRRVVVEHDGDLVDWQELQVPNLERTDPQLARELRRLVGRFERRRAARIADAAFASGLLRRTFRWLSGLPPI